MFRPPADSDSDDAFPIGLDGFDDGGEATDIEFGGRHLHHRSPEPVARRQWSARTKGFVVAGVAVLSVGAFVLADRGDDKTAVAPPPTTVAQSSASSNPGSKAVATTIPTLGPVLENDQGWGLFLFDQRASNVVQRLDLSTGALVTLKTDSLSGYLGLAGSGANAVVVQPQDVGGAYSAAPGPDGATWVAGDGAPQANWILRLVRVRPGSDPQVVANYDLGADSIFQRLVGSMPNGDPVFAAPDGSAFVYNPVSGAKYRLTNGMVLSSVDHGNYGDVECDPAAVCTLVLHGSSRTVSLPFSTDMSFSVSPDGAHALVGGLNAEGPSWQLIDLDTGEAHSLSEEADSHGPGGRGGDFAVWTPDGSTAFFVNGSHVVEVSTDGPSSRQIELPANFSSEASLIGVS